MVVVFLVVVFFSHQNATLLTAFTWSWIWSCHCGKPNKTVWRYYWEWVGKFWEIQSWIHQGILESCLRRWQWWRRILAFFFFWGEQPQEGFWCCDTIKQLIGFFQMLSAARKHKCLKIVATQFLLTLPNVFLLLFCVGFEWHCISYIVDLSCPFV